MKIRILDNSLRIRLGQSEVERLGTTGSLKAQTLFPNHTTLNYQLKITPLSTDATVSFEVNEILVCLNPPFAQTWIETDEVSLRATITLSNEGVFSVLVEKDFKCLVPRGEEDADGFLHPKASLGESC